MDDGHRFIRISKKLRRWAGQPKRNVKVVSVTLCFGESWRHRLPSGKGKDRNGFVTVHPANRTPVTRGYKYPLGTMDKFFKREFPESHFVFHVKASVPQSRKLVNGEIAQLRVGQDIDDGRLTVDVGVGSLTPQQIKEVPVRANVTRLLMKSDMSFYLDAAKLV